MAWVTLRNGWELFDFQMSRLNSNLVISLPSQLVTQWCLLASVWLSCTRAYVLRCSHCSHCSHSLAAVSSIISRRRLDTHLHSFLLVYCLLRLVDLCSLMTSATHDPNLQHVRAALQHAGHAELLGH